MSKRINKKGKRTAISEVKREYVMNYDNVNWDSFLKDLEALIEVFRCDARSLRLTDLLLQEKYIDCDIDATESFMQEHAGFCDCEVFLNVVGVENLTEETIKKLKLDLSEFARENWSEAKDK